MTDPADPLAKAAAELVWLKKNPQFEERPATVYEFLGPGYLDIESGIRSAIKNVLVEMMGDETSAERMTTHPRAMITGGVGLGKTTVASIVLPWMAHWVLCLKNPQEYFNLLPGSRIAFMQMSTSESQAKEVVFGDIKARIQHSEWFQNKYPYDPKFTNQIRFEKDIWILPGDSAETTFEGYNILGGILDEADSHKVTKDKDYAEVGYDTIDNRISSRFQNRGFFLVIGQMKKANGFASKKYKEFVADPDAYAVRMTIWESLGWDRWTDDNGVRDSFWYDSRRKQIIPTAAADVVTNTNLIEVPNTYRKQFETNPQKALRDLAGIPPEAEDPFISLADRIDACRDRWQARYPEVGSPVQPDGRIESWFRAPDTLPRVIHIDLAYSSEGDALGLAMGHCPEVTEFEGEMKPIIVFDLLMRWKAPAGGEIMLSDVRRFIYHLKDDLGFAIKMVTLDGFQSTDTRQQLTRRRISSGVLSVDRTLLPYHDLREAIYENRCEFPPYMVYLNRGDTDLVEIAVRELMQLTDDGRKVDHPHDGSKDVADAMAGVTCTLMGDRRYRRNVVSLDDVRVQREATGTDSRGMYQHPALGSFGSMSAPIPFPTRGSPYRGG